MEDLLKRRGIMIGKRSSDRVLIKLNLSDDNVLNNVIYEVTIDCNIPGLTDNISYLSTKLNADEIISGLRLKLRDNTGDAYKYYRTNPLLLELHCFLIALEGLIG